MMPQYCASDFVVCPPAGTLLVSDSAPDEADLSPSKYKIINIFAFGKHLSKTTYIAVKVYISCIPWEPNP